MQFEEVSQILTVFGANSGSQLKYYIVKSLFPDVTREQFIQSGILSETSFYKVKNTVDGYNLPSLFGDDNCTTEAAPATLNPDLVQLHDLIHELIDVKAARDERIAFEEEVLHLEEEISNLKNEITALQEQKELDIAKTVEIEKSNFDCEAAYATKDGLAHLPAATFSEIERRLRLAELNLYAARITNDDRERKLKKTIELLNNIYEDRKKLLSCYKELENTCAELLGENAPPRKFWITYSKEMKEYEQGK